MSFLHYVLVIVCLIGGFLMGLVVGKETSTVNQRITNQRDSLRNALDRAKLDSIKLEYYYQRKLKEVEK